MARATRSCRAPQAEIHEITEPPVLAVRSSIAAGLEIWQVCLTVGYWEIGSLERKELADLAIRLIIGRSLDRQTGTKPVDVMIVEYRCFSAILHEAIINWAREEWDKLYPNAPATTPVIVGWSESAPLDIRLRHQTFSWADDRTEQFFDARIFDAAGLEWSVGRRPPRLSVYNATATARVSADGSDELLNYQPVEAPFIVMFEDLWSETTEESDNCWLFWPTVGVQLGFQSGLRLGRVEANLRGRPRPLEDEVDPFTR